MSTVGDLMALVDSHRREWGGRETLRAALESALRASEQAGYERGRSEREQEPAPQTFNLLVLPPQTKPVYFVIKNRYNGDQSKEHRRFFYEEHSCPTNWLPEIEMLCFDGDTDPHGLLQYVRSVPYFEQPSDDGESLTDSFPELRAEPEQAAEPVAWEDPRVQIVYELLCSDEAPPPEEHWEGFIARKIVAALYASPPKREPLAGCSDLRDAKWLDPECCEAGACQSLRFKNKREPLTEERCVALAREFSGNPVPAIASPELWFLRGIRAAERAHGIGETP